jgi:hypothetical protein
MTRPSPFPTRPAGALAGAAFVLAAATAAPALAQTCAPQWLPGDPRPVPAGTVVATTTWDPDGAGPLTSRLVAGGLFAVGTETQVRVATWDGTTWTRLGAPLGSVRALAVHAGSLYAATYSGLNGADVELWNGTAWQVVGHVASGAIEALVSYGGTLVAAGSFPSISGVTASRIARWSGTSWSAFGSGITGDVRALASFDGALWAGGTITGAGGVAAGNLARWNGSAWTAVPMFNGEVRALAPYSTAAVGSGSLHIGGAFTAFTIGTQQTGATRVARYTPSGPTWSAIGAGVPGTRCVAMMALPFGAFGLELIAVVEDPGSAQRVWRFASNAWTALGPIEDAGTARQPRCLSLYQGRYTIGVEGSDAAAVRAWDGAQWRGAAGQGIASAVHALLPLGNGENVIGGAFRTISGVAVNGIARGTANAWTPLGTGVDGGGGVLALARAANGDVFAGGDFTTAGGGAAMNVARWNGSSWAPLGGGVDGIVRALLVLPNGDLIAGGDFQIASGGAAAHVARWNGSTWSAVGGGCFGSVRALALLADGGLVAGGDFAFAGTVAANRIARLVAGAWQPLGSGCNDAVLALATTFDGDLVAAGRFTAAGGVTGRVQRWRNGAWSPLPAPVIVGDVRALAVHPSGELFLGGDEFRFTIAPQVVLAVPLARIATSGVAAPMEVSGGAVRAVAAPADVLVGGAFTRAGTAVSTHFARLHASCPATAVAYGNACAGTAGTLALTVPQAPWVGGAFRLRAAPFAATSLGVLAFGAAPAAVPLPAVLGAALPGCTLHVAADLTDVVAPQQGVATWIGSVPASPALVGYALRAQMLQFELTPALAVSSSNAMTLVVGTL